MRADLGAAVPGLPVRETVKVIGVMDGGHRKLMRHNWFDVQKPQGLSSLFCGAARTGQSRNLSARADARSGRRIGVRVSIVDVKKLTSNHLSAPIWRSLNGGC
jgi:2-C-methyl-D-erythritol 4-phosphate cytidylyltransferase